MGIDLQSTTDSPEQVNQAKAGKVEAPEQTEVTQEAAPAVESESETPETPVEETEVKADDSATLEDEPGVKASGDEDETELDAKGDEQPKERKGFRRRVKKLSQKLTASEQETAFWKAEALKAKGPSNAEEPQEENLLASENDKPIADEYESQEDFVEALTDWKLEQKLASRDQAAQETKLKTEQEGVIKAHTEKLKEFAEKTEDFEDVMESVDDINMSMTVQQAILHSEDSPQLMYELAKDKAEYARICALPPMEAARAIGRFEAKLPSASSEKTKITKPIQTTRAPAPIAPLGTKGPAGGNKSIYDADLSQKDFERMRNEQEAASASY